MEPTSKSGFIALIGPANAGKSTLLNALLGQKVSIVSAKPHTTRDRILGIKHIESAECIYVDSPGFCAENYNGALSRYLRKSLRQASSAVDLCVLVLDGQALSKDFKSIDEALKLLKRDAAREPDLIALNKVDALSKEILLPLIQQLFEKGKEFFGRELEIFPLSALKEFRLKEFERSIVSRLPEGVRCFPEDDITDRSDAFLAGETVREKLFAALKQELPYSTAVRIESIKEEPKLVRITGVILVERDSQKGIVIGKGGAMLKEIGIRARRELEEHYQRQVHLELTVRVEKGWTESDKGLQKVGYEV